jgi:OOP family OmpA-OmpF porin
MKRFFAGALLAFACATGAYATTTTTTPPTTQPVTVQQGTELHSLLVADPTATAGAAASAGASGAANVQSTSDTRALSLGFPPPVHATALPPIRCRSESDASSSGWTFFSNANSTTDRDGLCQASDAAAVLFALCQYKSGLALLYKAVNGAYKGLDLTVPEGTVNLAPGTCNRPVTPTPPADKTPPPDTNKPVPQRLTLKGDALFDTDSYEVKPGAAAALDQLAERMLSAQLEKVVITGHTDDRASDAYNLDLSVRRAEAIRAALVLRGVSPALMVTQGIGKRQPIADNGTDAGRQMNRRVTIDISGTVKNQ